jgi:hypothetical protein
MRTINSQKDVDNYNECKRIVETTSKNENRHRKLIKYSLAKDCIKYPELMQYSFDFLIKL